MLRGMRHVVQAVTAVRLALATRRDLLLEVLALRHQLAVLARSNRRFRTSDRLLWLLLRRSWAQWKDALLLVQPATVDRWHRDRFDRRWWRRSRRPGRPRIDSQVRDLIGHLADENRLWGAPRIHGELLKMGIVVSERTVSRYLRGRPRTPSQTWRTFLANHLGQVALISDLASPDGPCDYVVDALANACCSKASSDWRCASTQCALVDGLNRFGAYASAVLSLRITLPQRIGARSTGRGPPRGCAGNAFRPPRAVLRPRPRSTLCDGQRCKTVRVGGAKSISAVLASMTHWGFNVAHPLPSDVERHVYTIDSRVGDNIG